MTMCNSYPRLLADIGGTNARFAIETAPSQIRHQKTLAAQDFPQLIDAIDYFLTSENQKAIQHVAIAIANPVTSDTIKMTNHHWSFSIQQMKSDLQAKTLLIINDFTAQALAIPAISSEHLLAIGSPLPTSVDAMLPIAVVGPGTGLGVSGLIPNGQGQMIALAGEGGHVSFSPRDAVERELLAFAEEKFQGHVSAERLLRGEGLTLLYEFFAKKAGISQHKKKTPAEVTHGALVQQDGICLTVLSRYCRMLGDTCANVALTIGATGGVYLCGGIVPRFVDFLRQSDFRACFEDKGRFATCMKKIPVYVVNHDNPGLLGASMALKNHL
ncbi:MAG: glucokinase [Gammaproteobacteria bacterium]|nr:MAG: glucokinase [Gammaproteobacteria bacterium]